MKIALSLVLLLVVLLTPLYPVYAQTNVGFRDSTSTGALRPFPLKNATSAGRLMELKEKFQEKRDSFREKVANFRDRKKAERTERINNNLEKISQRILNAFLNVLDKFSNILERAESRLSNAPEGTQKSNAQTAINNAKAKIAESQDLLNSLMENDYTMEISSETTVREEAMDARNTLRDDLAGARTSLMETKSSVIAAIRAVSLALSEEETSGE